MGESRINEQMMDFQQTLLKVDQSLNREDVQALVFLSADLLEKDVCWISTGQDLFTRLQELDLLTPERPSLIAELLRVSKRNGLLRQLGLNDLPLVPQEGLVSPYRKLLFDLSENITSDNLQSIKFLLYNTLPRKKLEDDMTMLNLLLEMEKEDYLSNTNLETLESIIQTVCPNLRRKIIQYKENICPLIQETGEPYVNARHAQPEEFSAYPGDHMEPRKGACSYDTRPADSGSGDDLIPLFNFNTTQPHTSSQETCAVSSEVSNLSAASLDTPDAGMEGLSLGQLSSSGKTDATFSSEQSHNAFFTSSCEGKNLAAEEKEELEAYAMGDDRTRGVCLIINNYDFSKSHVPLKNRTGTDVDEKCLVEVFEWLGLETRIAPDCSQQSMRSLLTQLSEEDHGGTDCLVCCVLSHGKQGVVYGVDGRELFLRDLTGLFSADRCASLRGKPKLFFIQACQGSNEQRAVPIQSDSPGSAEPDLDTDAVVPQDSIPEEADFLLGMATVSNFASFRDRKMGTWYIQSLCRNLLQLVPKRCDLLSILTKVNHDVSRMSDITGKRKQMPQPAYTLRKRVVFPVPKQPTPS